MKTCYVCNKLKDIDKFHKHKAMSDGHLNKCKTCHYEYVKEYRSKNPDVRKKEYSKFAKRKGSMSWNEYMEKRSKNKKTRNEIASKHSQKRRMKISNILGEFDDFVISESFSLRELRCELLKCSWHVDHIIPLHHKNASGLHNAFNVQVVPSTWNVRKSNKTMDKYLGI